MAAYNPNFNDPRILRRIKKAIGWTVASLNDHTPKAIAQRYIIEIFGQGQHDLAKFIKANTIQCSDDRYGFDSDNPIPARTINVKNTDRYKDVSDKKKHFAKKYVSKDAKIIALIDRLNLKLADIVPPAVYNRNNNKTDLTIRNALALTALNDLYGNQINSGEFVYNDQSNRLWNGLQNASKEYRRPLLKAAGYSSEYDIVSCFPTLILQHAKMKGLTKELPYLEGYVLDKGPVVDVIMASTGATYEQTKKAINALLAGARMDQGILSIFASRVMMTKFSANDYVNKLKEEQKILWSVVKPNDTGEMYKTKKGTYRLGRTTAKHKMARYFLLERQVMDVANAYARSITNNRVFLIHDGFTCSEEVSTINLSKVVKESTGFDVTFKRTYLPGVVMIPW